jgi:hypothetical protein
LQVALLASKLLYLVYLDAENGSGHVKGVFYAKLVSTVSSMLPKQTATMGGRQRTFELIPTTLVNLTEQPQRMTSKQVKKAYQKKHKGPKISRAEQKRLAAEELARQKTDYERERSCTRSKVVREKKAVKELAEKAERKKNGLPEPSRFVRASQPMISMFVKNGIKRSWKEMAEIEKGIEESDGIACEQEERLARRVAVSEESDEEFGDFPSFSQSNLPELLATVKNPSKTIIQCRPATASAIRTNIDDEVHNTEADVSELCQPRTMDGEDEHLNEDEAALSYMTTTQLLSEAAKATEKNEQLSCSPLRNMHKHRDDVAPRELRDTMGPIPRVSSRTPSQDSFARDRVMVFSDINGRKMPAPKAARPDPQNYHRALRDMSTNIQLPPMISERSLSIGVTPPRQAALYTKSPQSMLPPSATQIFLEIHLDDFFPSASQEIRELLKDLDDIPSNTQVAKELDADELKDVDPLTSIVSTQDCILSPQDLVEIDALSRPTTNMVHTRSPLNPSRPRFFVEKDDDLFHAALHESKIPVVRDEPRTAVPLKEAPAKGTRTLIRIQSTATDYGDAEFDEEELLGLC